MGAEANRGETGTRRHNEAALAGLYGEYYDKIVRYAFIHIGNRAEAEDIAGEAFLKALESLGSYKERGVPMQAWLFRIAHNLVVDHLRKRARYKTIPIDAVQIESAMNPAAAAEVNIELERVSRAMERLTAAQREVIGLRFFGGLTSGEVGRILNKSSGAVREMQRAAVESLRRLLHNE